MKTIASIALVVLLAGCAGGGSSAPSTSPVAPSAIGRHPLNGGPGTTSLIYYDTYGVVGQCNTGVLTLMNGYAPAHNLSFPAGQGPPLVVSLCNFSTPQYVRVTLGTPTSGAPFIRQTDYTVTVDAPDSAGVTATWTACGSSSTCSTPGLTGTVTYTIGPPDNGGGL